MARRGCVQPPARRARLSPAYCSGYARRRRAGAVHQRATDGKATTALPARPPIAARPDAGRHRGVLVRPALDVALRVRRSHLRAGAWPPGAACCTGRRGCAASRDWRRRLHCWPYVMPVANSPNYLEMEPSIARPTHGQGRIDWPPEIDATLVRRGSLRPGR